MNFRGHLIGGTTAAVIAGAGCLFLTDYENWGAASAVAAGAWIGAQLPDLDIASTPRKWFGRLGTVFVLFCLISAVSYGQEQLLMPAGCLGLLSLLLQSGWIRHRGITHKYLFVLLLNYHSILPFIPGLILTFIPEFSGTVIPYILTGLSFGIVTHLLLDSIFPWHIKNWV